MSVQCCHPRVLHLSLQSSWQVGSAIRVGLGRPGVQCPVCHPGICSSGAPRSPRPPHKLRCTSWLKQDSQTGIGGSECTSGIYCNTGPMARVSCKPHSCQPGDSCRYRCWLSFEEALATNSNTRSETLDFARKNFDPSPYNLKKIIQVH